MPSSKFSRKNLKHILRTDAPCSRTSMSSSGSDASDICVDYVVNNSAQYSPHVMPDIRQKYANIIDKNNLFCPKCTLRFSGQGGRKAYNVHIRTDHKLLRCIVCNTAVSFNQYKIHLKNVHGIRPQTVQCNFCLEPKHDKGQYGRLGCPVLVLFETRNRPYMGGSRKRKGKTSAFGTKYSHVSTYDSEKNLLHIDDTLEVGAGKILRILKRSHVRLPDDRYPASVISELSDDE